MIKVLECVAGLKLAVRLSCYLQPKISDPDIFRLMKEAGCIAIDFGTDSGSTAMLSSLRKPFTKDDIRIASKACMDTGIDFCHSLILGGPGETPETIRETVDLMDQVRPRAIVAMTGVRIYPGTEIRHIAVDQGMISMQESLLEPSFYFSRMGPSSLLKCAYEAGNRRSNWFFPGKRDWGKSIGFKILHFLYRRGPLWRAFSK